MNRFDTLKMSFVSSAIEYINDSYYEEITGKDRGSEQNNYLLLRLKKDSKPLGVSSLRINPKNETVQIEHSAKVLQENYSNSIHRNNIEEAIQKINKTGIIKLNPNRFIDTAEMYRFDVCENLEGFQNEQGYINTLNIIALANKDIYTRPYEGEGISFKYKAKGRKTESRTYPKYTEMKKSKNKEIVQHTGLERFKGVLRPETQFQTFKEMREALKLQKGKIITLTDILNSEIPLLHNAFSDILKYNLKTGTKKLWSLEMIENLDRIMCDENLSLSEIEKLAGRLFILKRLESLDSVNVFIRSKVKGNISNYKRTYRELKAEMISEKDIQQVTEFMNKLKAAA